MKTKHGDKKIADETLVARSQAGDEQATEELMFRYRGLVRKLARGFFLVDGETEDLIQEGMMGLFQATTGYQREKNGAFKTFAYTCIRRRLIDAVRSSQRKKHDSLTDAIETDEGAFFGVDPEEMIVLTDERKELMNKMSRVLSDFEFKIFSMYIDGMTTADICEATGKPYKSVDNAIQRSKRKIQALLES